MINPYLERCEAEQLHLSGAIQAHGCLLVADPTGLVSHASANIGEFLGIHPQDWINQPLPAEWSSSTHELGNLPGSRRLRSGLIESPTGALDVITTRGANGEIIFEVLPHQQCRETRRPTPPLLLEPPTDPLAQDALRQSLVNQVAEMTGFQRVMFYQFREDGDGEVVAEAHTPEAYGSYLGLRFPASDIPQIARALYLKNPWRLIPDAHAQPVPILGRTSTPPDLTWSDLRSVSPVHLVYLANMGVVASLSFPVVINGALVALIAAHHREPRALPAALLEQIATLTRSHAFAFAGYQSQRRIRLIDGMRYRFEAVRSVLQRHADLFSAWTELAEWLIREFRVDGAVLCQGDECCATGLHLASDALEIIDEWFCDQAEFVVSTESLSRQLPAFPLSEVAGILAIRIGNREGGEIRLYLTRTEHVHEVAWGGSPEKPIEYHDGTLGIAPRRSFEKWVEKRLGYSRPWDNESRLLALKLRELLQREILS